MFREANDLKYCSYYKFEGLVTPIAVKRFMKHSRSPSYDISDAANMECILTFLFHEYHAKPTGDRVAIYITDVSDITRVASEASGVSLYWGRVPPNGPFVRPQAELEKDPC